jgi:phosphohistidine phosphatase SixA
MKQIFLLRHAKSDWITMGQQDFDRGLASRGIKDISLISDYVKKITLS